MEPSLVPCRRSPAEVCASYGVDPAVGLTSSSVQEHTRRFGKNVLESKPPKSLFAKVAEQFEDYLVRILLASAVVSFVLAVLGGSFETDGLAALVEPFVILIILVANAVIAIAQDNDSEKALEELTRLQPVLARVKREGHVMEIPAEDLVPGDVIEVHVGDKVPADARVIEIMSMALKIEQSGLTGENVAVEKTEEAIVSDRHADAIIDQSNMIFSATTVVSGYCRALVVATGMQTQIGIIQSAVMDADEEPSKTPLAEKIDEFGEQLAHVIAVICVVVWAINYKHFTDPEHGGWLAGCVYYFKIAISLAVAAIPEGLPAVITTCLALGTRKMTARNAIVRHLPSVETLGCTTVICSDKTGTLTTNEMVVVKMVLFGDTPDDLETYKIEGTSFEPRGLIQTDDVKQTLLGPMSSDRPNMAWLARICCLNNNSSFEPDSGVNSPGGITRYLAKGEPTEVALKVLVEKLGCPDQALNREAFNKSDRIRNHDVFGNYWTSEWDKVLTIEFDRSRKCMSEYVRHTNGTTLLLVKGAPESVLLRATNVMTKSGTTHQLTHQSKRRIENTVKEMARQGLRILLLALRSEVTELKGLTSENKRQFAKGIDLNQLERELTIVGLVAMKDPPRPEVASALQQCKAAGIVVHMITGDNQLTAESIGAEIGIVPRNVDLAARSYAGIDFEAMSPDEQLAILRESNGLILSRMEPKHKQLIVKRLRELGHVIAMTGDGVNDAPALKNADIGISMGITGSAVAKEACDMILADDNFGTIVAAIEEGRSIYNNMKAFIRYLISSNIGEVASIFITAALGIPEGLNPVQLLWVNLVTDGPPATALGFNPPDVDVMEKGPRGRTDPLISRWVFVRYMIVGLYVGFATVAVFIWWYCFDSNSGHTTITINELMNWGQCSSWTHLKPVFDGVTHVDPCSIFHAGKATASSMSLSVLVVIEMLNALNAISENHSLLTLPPWHNHWLLLAITSSIVLHCAILYIPWASALFGVVPLGLKEWKAVMLFSLPVILIEEVLKFITRRGGMRRDFALPMDLGRDVELKKQ